MYEMSKRMAPPMAQPPQSKLRGRLLLSMILIIACGSCIAIFYPKQAPNPANTNAQKAYDSGDWATAARLANQQLRTDRADQEAVRILARSSAREGRDDIATSLYENRLGLRAMQAEDHFLLGRIIAGQGNSDLALGIWEKALKTDPDHAEMLESFACMSAQKMHLEEAVTAVSRLAGRPGLEAKGLLLQGIFKSLMEDPAGSAKSIGQALQIDDKIQSSFMTSDQQMKLFIKDLLRTSQPAEARVQINRFYGDSAANDLEIGWLLSRIEMQEGQAKPESNWAKQGQAYRQSNPLAMEPAGYVGSARCVKCHTEITENYRQTRHANSFHHGPALLSLPRPSKPLQDFDDPLVSHAVQPTADGRMEIVTRRDDQEVLRVLVDYAFGTPDRYLTMVGRDQNKTYRAARISHYAGLKGSGWDRTSGDTGHSESNHDVMGQEVHARDGVVRCLACHVTTPRDFRGNRPADEKRTAAAADSGIGCEKCHGPGENHLAAIKLNLPDPAIRSLTGLNAGDVNKACVDCHTVGDPREVIASPEDPKWVRSAGVTFPLSKCFKESQGQLSCLSCHAPHQPSPDSPAFYESKCLQCHSADKPAKIETQFKTVICKINAKKDCLNCHMPKVPVPVLHDSLTDHYIRVRKAQ